MGERVRVRTGLYQDQQGHWHVVVDANGHLTVAERTWPTEREAESAAVGIANRVRESLGMEPLRGAS